MGSAGSPMSPRKMLLVADGGRRPPWEGPLAVVELRFWAPSPAECAFGS